ncbi:hypothetical protein HK096_008156 [Nowakowskiella sp. JEL0078]|nr:hypothetical protein HK096_008156 [Nowakowskiella sp. JEL0078]
MSGDLAVRVYLTTHLFVGFETGQQNNTSTNEDKDCYHEKLLFHTRIRDFDKAFQHGSIHSSISISADADDENITPGRKSGVSIVGFGPKISMNEKKSQLKEKDKVRYICITVKKNMKIRLHKIKQEKAAWQISKTWSLDDIKSIENSEA